MRLWPSNHGRKLIVRPFWFLRASFLLMLAGSLLLAFVGFGDLATPVQGFPRPAAAVFLVAGLAFMAFSLLYLRVRVRCDGHGVKLIRFPPARPRSLFVPVSEIDHLEAYTPPRLRNSPLGVMPTFSVTMVTIVCKDGSVVKLDPAFIVNRSGSIPDRHKVIQKRIMKMDAILGLSRQP
jgi:hypothetical protein